LDYNEAYRRNPSVEGVLSLKKNYGEPYNVNKEIIGRIVYGKVKRRFCPTSILVTNNFIDKDFNYAGILTEKKYHNALDLKNIKYPIYFNVRNIKELHEGDIVLLEQNGNIVILFEKDSPYNVLMLTEQCNCACLMCPQAITRKRDDKTDINLKLIPLIDKSTKCLGITGGEPSLLDEGLFQIIEACKQHLPNTSLEILSNGIKFSSFEFAKKLAILEHPDLTIAISLYGDNDSEHNYIVQTKGFYSTLQGLYNLALFKQKIEIRIVMHALTYKRLSKLAEFIYHNFPFVIHVAFMGMEIRESAIKNIDKLWIAPDIYSNELELAISYLNRRDMNVSIYNLPLCVLPKKLWRFSRKSISSWKRIYLEKCKDCIVCNECGGLFYSPVNRYIEYIYPVKF
jgi:His-Xaa-Ser system radical SAM maturase HxsC